MFELTAQRIFALTRWVAQLVGIVEAKTAPKNLAGDVKGLLGTSAQILTSNGAMLSALGAQAWRGDVILLGEAHNFNAGEVCFICQMGEHV